MTVAVSFDRAEEKTLLGGLFDTVQFDEESAGVPVLQPEDDDEDGVGSPEGASDFHLPDRHPQERHGNRYTTGPDGLRVLKPKPPKPAKAGGKTAKKKVKKEWLERRPGSSDSHNDPELREVLEGMFEYRDAKTGMEMRLATGSASGGQIHVDLNMFDRDGKGIGTAERVIEATADGRRKARHEFFQIYFDDPPIQGGGFATRWLKNLEAEYRENDIEEIELHADIDVGGYAWAKMGFDFRDDRTASRLGLRLEALVDAQLAGNEQQRRAVFGELAFTDDALITARELAHMAQVGGERRPTPMEFAMLGWEPGREMWPGKRFMLGSDWQGVKQL